MEKYILHECHTPDFLWADQIIRTSLRSRLGQSRNSYRTKRDPRKAVPQRVSGGYLPTPHPRAYSKMESIIGSPLKIQTQRKAREAERNKSFTCNTLLAALGVHDPILCCLRTSCGLCSPCAFKQKVMLGVSPLVVLQEIPVKL